MPHRLRLAATAVVLAALLLSSCATRAQPQGLFRFYTRPFQGLTATCWPLPVTGPLDFGWLPTFHTIEHDRRLTRLRLEYQLFGPTPEAAVADVVASLTQVGFVVGRHRSRNDVRASRPDFGTVEISARSLPGAAPQVPVTAVMTVDERLASAEPLLHAGLCHDESGQS